MAGSSPFNVIHFLSVNLLNSVKNILGKTPIEHDYIRSLKSQSCKQMSS